MVSRKGVVRTVGNRSDFGGADRAHSGQTELGGFVVFLLRNWDLAKTAWNRGRTGRFVCIQLHLWAVYRRLWGKCAVVEYCNGPTVSSDEGYTESFFGKVERTLKREMGAFAAQLVEGKHKLIRDQTGFPQGPTRKAFSVIFFHASQPGGPWG